MLRRIFNNPLSALIISVILFIGLWMVSLFPNDYKLGVFLQYTGVTIFLTALFLCLVWLVWRIRTVYAEVKGISTSVSPDSKAKMASGTYLAISIVMLAAAIISVG